MIEPECQHGYTWQQVKDILGRREEEFWRWMRGQTVSGCQQEPQREWRKDTEAPGGMCLVDVGPPLCDRPHGMVVYPWDVKRFLDGGPIID